MEFEKFDLVNVMSGGGTDVVQKSSTLDILFLLPLEY